MDPLPFDEYVRSLDRKRMSAGVLFRDADERVLLVEPSYKAQWDIPGGAVDAGEAPWAAARREIREELGLDRTFSRLLVIDHVHDDGRMPEGIAFIFDGGSITGDEVDALDITDPEIISAALVSLDDAVALVKPSLTTRLTVALRAGRSGELVLCDDGTPIR
ncbi:MAG TPA: NUDIX hydrolase [Amycolatopsis sp.]|nr:NUDIX hydrolase [Amycolatopsis sp.]